MAKKSIKVATASSSKATEEFIERFQKAIREQEVNPSVQSIADFCRYCGCSKRTLYKPEHEDRLNRVKALPSLQAPGNPLGWSQNGRFAQSSR